VIKLESHKSSCCSAAAAGNQGRTAATMRAGSEWVGSLFTPITGNKKYETANRMKMYNAGLFVAHATRLLFSLSHSLSASCVRADEFVFSTHDSKLNMLCGFRRAEPFLPVQREMRKWMRKERRCPGKRPCCQ